MLDGDAFETHGIGIAGVKGFGGGFGQRALAPWGETIIKQFVREAVDEALEARDGARAPAPGASHRPAALLARPADRGRRAAGNLPVPGIEPPRRTDQSLPGVARPARPRAPRTAAGRDDRGVPVYNVSMPLLTRSFADRPPFRIFEMPARRVDGRIPGDFSHVDASTCLPMRGATAATGRDASPDAFRRKAALSWSSQRSTWKPPQRARSTTLPPPSIWRRCADCKRRHSVSDRGCARLSHYSKVPRNTKDVDVFVKPPDCPRVSRRSPGPAIGPDMPFPHWLGKVRQGEHFMDVIFNSGNGIARVDDLWFDHAPKADVLGLIVRMSPVER